LIACLLAAGAGVWSAVAQPSPKINSISPQWIQRGVTNQIVIEGENLFPITRFILSNEREISASVYTPEGPVKLEANEPGVLAAVPNSDKRVTIRIAAAPDTTPGEQEFRVVTPRGVSNPMKFHLSDIPEVAEKSDNNSLEKAQVVALPAGISGRVGGAGETDYFRFAAKKGERLIFDVLASRAGSPLDSSLALLDASGKELARNEDANGFDSLIDFMVPADGDYALQLRDFRYRGGPEYTYHIRGGALPYLDSIFPAGGQRGKAVEVKLHGRNLDENATVKLQLDEKAPLKSIELRGHAALGYSNPRQFAVGRYAEFIEQEPNDAAENANTIELPSAVNGRIDKEKDVDVFKFKASKGQRFIFEAQTGNFGSPLDAVLTLRNKGNSILQQNNGQGGANARIDQTFGEDGEYFVSVRDLQDRGGEDFVYRLTVQPPPAARFGARLAMDNARVCRGGRMLVRVEAERSDFGGPIEVSIENAPRGVHCEPLLITSDMPGGWLEISADENAERGSWPVKLVASAEMGGRKISKPGGGQGAVDGPFLTVLDAPPFTVNWTTLAANVRQDSSETLQGTVTRSDNFKGEINVTLQGFNAAGEDIGKSLETGPVKVAPEVTNFSIPIKAKLTSETGTRSIMLRAEGKMDGADYAQYSQKIPLTVSEFPFVLSSSLPRLSLTVLRPGVKSEAGQAEFSVRVERRGWFTDAIALNLEGLPEGIVATATNLGPNMGDALIRLTTNEKAKAGTNNFTIIGTTTVNNNSFRQRGPTIVLTVNPAAESADTAKE
jgi:hypothetical protein